MTQTRHISSVPIPKLVSISGALVTNFVIDKDTSNSILEVPLLNPKFAAEHSANACELRVRGTSEEIITPRAACSAGIAAQILGVR